KNRIEKAALEAGADVAVWDAPTQKITLQLGSSKTSAEAVLQKIADAGHDNEMFQSTEKAYKDLPAYCVYSRTLAFGEKNPLVHIDEQASESVARKDFSDHPEHYEHSIETVTITKERNVTALSRKDVGLTFNIS